MKISVLGSGSKGNSSAILIDKRAIMIDAGFFYRDLVERMKEIDLFPESIIAILITHEHNDHIKGLGTFVKRHKVPVYISTSSYDNLSRTVITDLGNNVVLFNAGQSLKIGEFEVHTFSVSHDSADAVGFTIKNDNRKAGYITDIGEITETVVDNLKHCNLVVIESNHDPQMLKNGSYHAVLKQRISGPKGHISNQEAAELVENIYSPELKYVLLSHLSGENNDPLLALETIKNSLRAYKENAPKVRLTYQSKPTEWFDI